MNFRRDDDDDFLYGGGTPQPQTTPVPVTPSASLGNFPSSEQIVAQLEAQAAAAEASINQAADVVSVGDDNEEAVDLGSETEDDEDVRVFLFSMDYSDQETRMWRLLWSRSRGLLIFVRQSSGSRAPPPRSTSSAAPVRAQPSLTTEYTPIQRAGAAPPPRATPQAQPTPQPTPQAPSSSEPPPSTPAIPQAEPPPQTSAEGVPTDDGVDPSTLPPVSAPPSHPAIDPNATGTLEGRSIIDVDLSSMTDKQWRKPGSDISDWFNYGFDELSWEAYCYRRRDLGELANVLKTNVLNFSGMPEDQLTALPPEVRQMVMTGTTAMMNGAGNPAMMGQGMMMDMSGMMGPMGMGMNGGEMGMANPMMQMGMQDGGQGQVGNGGGNGTPENNTGGMMQEGFVGNPAMMGMGMEFGGAGKSFSCSGLHTFDERYARAGTKPDGAAADVSADGGASTDASNGTHRARRGRCAIPSARPAWRARFPGQRARAGIRRRRSTTPSAAHVSASAKRAYRAAEPKQVQGPRRQRACGRWLGLRRHERRADEQWGAGGSQSQAEEFAWAGRRSGIKTTLRKSLSYWAGIYFAAVPTRSAELSFSLVEPASVTLHY
ncbi:Fip1-domain-containing protein [Mycena venus]|uniref:Fip1-domain-containing protein n=1 Tax=Mycena venus TaxID=2733690 RepID=A0A8H7CU44_9AGAR|nr:Fip1-domain-containing protein [Mycena venus]